jgi:hypothetical protein
MMLGSVFEMTSHTRFDASNDALCGLQAAGSAGVAAVQRVQVPMNHICSHEECRHNDLHE